MFHSSEKSALIYIVQKSYILTFVVGKNKLEILGVTRYDRE